VSNNERIISVSVALALLLGFAIGLLSATSKIRQEAIERGYMIHDPQTGKLEWVEREGEE
jgi:hypothetical protein